MQQNVRMPTWGVGLAAALLVGCGDSKPVAPVVESGPQSKARVPTIPSGPYTAGTSYVGRAGYIEYIAGTLPVIITAPHGGSLTPTEIPDRAGGTNVTDSNTEQLARAVASAFFTRTGKWPHVIITKLKRTKIDTNRDSAEATEGNVNAVTAWFEFHDFIGVARQAITASGVTGFYVDLHGHGTDGHPDRLELGYLLSKSDLALADASLNTNSGYEGKSSIRSISEGSPLSFSELLRGADSFGALMAAEGYPSVPSLQIPNVGSSDYFDGGYNTARYGCAAGGPTCGLQIEAHYAGVRDNSANRDKFAAALAKVVDLYLRTHTTVRLSP